MYRVKYSSSIVKVRYKATTSFIFPLFTPHLFYIKSWDSTEPVGTGHVASYTEIMVGVEGEGLASDAFLTFFFIYNLLCVCLVVQIPEISILALEIVL